MDVVEKKFILFLLNNIMSLIHGSKICKYSVFTYRVFFDLFIEVMCQAVLGPRHIKSQHSLNLHPSMGKMKK